jgi:ribosomal protection tetracycline resistance protein
MSYKGSHYYLIDKPGHIDFSPEMERSIQVMDYAIIIISAVEGLEGHTETVWQLLRKHHVPTFFFINKTDRVGADVQKVIEEIRSNLTDDVFDITESFEAGVMKEDLIEFIAERNEFLLDFYMEKGYQKDWWLKAFQEMIREGRIFPCASGSALQDIGIGSFLEKLDQLSVTDYRKDEPFSGRVYKIRHDDNGTRITFIKALSGTLKVRDEIGYGKDKERNTEKVTQIRIYNGNKYKTTDHVSAGEILAVIGLTETFVGDGLGFLREKVTYEMIPALKSKVNFDPTINIKEALRFVRYGRPFP